MSEKRDSPCFPDVEAKKKMKLDVSSSGGRDFNYKQERDDSEEGAAFDNFSSFRNPTETDASSGSIGASERRTLLYQKVLTQNDIWEGSLMIPKEYGKKFLPEPSRYNGRYEIIRITLMSQERKRQIWPMEAFIHERSNSYMLYVNWDAYVRKFKLGPNDTIFFYHDPTVPTDNHYLIAYEKKGRDRNPKETPPTTVHIKKETFLVGKCIHSPA